MKEANEITRLRTCRKWDKTRKKALERDHYLCRVCFAQGKYNLDRVEVHHIIPLAEDAGQAYDQSNLITLCIRHHKDAEEGRIDRLTLRDLVRDGE